MPLVRVYYVVGTKAGFATVKWYVRFHPWSGRDGEYLQDAYTSEKQGNESTIENWSGADSDICPTLRISRAGEVKIIVECSLCNNGILKFSDNKETSGISKSKLFGFLFLSPQAKAGGQCYFTTIAIFTPQGGFSETPPQ